MDTRTQEFYDGASVDVAQRTEVDGVTLLRSTQSRFYAESASQPGTLYLLTGFSCQCAGFAYRQTCRHHRALMSALGWTDEAPHRFEPPSDQERWALCGLIVGVELGADTPGYQELMDHLLYGDPLPAAYEPLRTRCRAMLRAMSERLEA